jgi:hypothetical protein
MNRLLKYCLRSQAMADRAASETDPLKRKLMVEDARYWFVMAQAEMNLRYQTAHLRAR